VRLLLDSHIILWWSAGDPRLGKRAERLLVRAENELLVSAASWWELAVKRTLGRLQLDMGIMLLTRDKQLKRYGTPVLCV
jgi:PIN domain nuclease of toxin-antitoxin system